MFNVINSVVALARLNPPAVEPTLIQLSQLLRYMLYVSDEERIALGRKMEYLNSYIQLQKLRFGSDVNVEFDAHIGSPEKTIEPMLLIPFVENAFKHGTGDVTNPSIAISLIADERMLDFRVSNQYNPVELNKDEHHGIGLNNIKRRLELLYPNKHRLDIQQLNSTYNIHLQLQLK
jgi:LytS/YehU family sensor histidine kinase